MRELQLEWAFNCRGKVNNDSIENDTTDRSSKPYHPKREEKVYGRNFDALHWARLRVGGKCYI